MQDYEIVWMVEERTFARLTNLGAFFSTVVYTQAGIDYELQVTNDEFEYLDEGEEADSDRDTED